jgi:predicted RNase H-like HicB family nuclease
VRKETNKKVWEELIMVVYSLNQLELPECHTQGKTLDEVIEVKEAIQVYLEADGLKGHEHNELVGVQFVAGSS